MKWITTHTWQYKEQARSCWHIWYAWHPVSISKYPDGAHKMVWLKKVLRRGEFIAYPEDCYWQYEYKDSED